MTICAIAECKNEASARPYQIAEGVTLHLCQSHMYDVASRTKERMRKLAVDLNAVGGIARHTEGWTYVVRLANGNVKIGMTGKVDANRLQGLSKNNNGGIPVQVLAFMRGGESREALSHGLWSHLKVQGAMEEFHPDPDLLYWAEAQGIDPVVSDFEDWQVTRHNRKNAPVPEMFGDVAEQIRKLQGQGEDDFWM